MKKQKDIEITKQARKTLEALSLQDRTRIFEALHKYSRGEPVKVKKLKTSPHDKRIRVGQYRIIIEETDKVYVISILNRKDAYRWL
jgi:mRNA-degrading endonuclease RelE of RelBE toxin-antitoxin system